MIKFVDGPAADTSLHLQRAPRYLRVVIDDDGTIDALDQLKDKPTAAERVVAYQVVGEIGRLHILRRPKGGGTSGSGWFATGEYKLIVESPPDESVMRDNELWQDWCVNRAAAEPERADDD